MSSDNSGKRRRMAHEGCDGLLQRLLHMGGVSNAGLSNILQEIRRSIPADLPGCSASQINQAALDRFMGLRFVDRLALADDEGFVEFEYVDPAAFLSTSISESPLLARTFRAALETAPSSPSSPWRLVLGFDEFAPGNKLKTDNRRKTMVMSFSFLELGQALGRLAVKFVRAPPLASGMCWVSDAYRFSVSLRPPSCEAVRFPRSFRGGAHNWSRQTSTTERPLWHASGLGSPASQCGHPRSRKSGGVGRRSWWPSCGDFCSAQAVCPQRAWRWTWRRRLCCSPGAPTWVLGRNS